ncbi:MAG: SAM-dependent methyltransferase [Ruminococcaceae bacterium]|nr:SAM-dependent methyltransferase [Oscillospiraceae bacterium]
MNTSNELDNRLLSCAEFVREGSIVADIGSDHAYLPIYLVKKSISPYAIASDINEGPVKRAKTNIALCALSNKITALCADGLDKAAEYRPDDIVIAGMGGELICSIISASEYVKNNNVRMILQPMTMTEVLREYLAENGFEIIDEKITVAADKCYTVICAQYDGKKHEYTRDEIIFGRANIDRIKKGHAAKEDFIMLERMLLSVKRRIDGKKKSKLQAKSDIESEIYLQKKLEELLEYKENYNHAN